MDFPARLNEIMEQRKISAYRLSKDAGITERLIGYWKKGEKLPTTENILKVAAYFNVTTGYLLGAEKEPAAPEREQPADELSMRLARRIINLPPQDMERVMDYVDLLERQDTSQGQ